MKRFVSFVLTVAGVLAVGGLINYLDGLDGEPDSPTPSPSVRPRPVDGYDPDAERYEERRDECTNWFYC